MNESKAKKIAMIVDDDTDVLEQHSLVLKNAGYSVAACTNRKEAEEFISGQKPDISIVDIMMETSDAGFILCYHIKKKYPDSPVIILTSVTGETGISFEAGNGDTRAWVKADVLLRKPVRPEQLLREMEKLLATKR
jgi:two-component system, OmpR family, response regulator